MCDKPVHQRQFDFVLTKRGQCEKHCHMKNRFYDADRLL